MGANGRFDRRTEPSPVRLNSARLGLVLSLLEGSSLDDLSPSISRGLSALEHFNPICCFCIVVEVLALDFLAGLVRQLGRFSLDWSWAHGRNDRSFRDIT